MQEDDEGIDISNTNESEKNRFNAADASESGPYVYELFSIMIHSGSASGGHYYAYIKDFKQGEWFCFNDQSVSRVCFFFRHAVGYFFNFFLFRLLTRILKDPSVVLEATILVHTVQVQMLTC